MPLTDPYSWEESRLAYCEACDCLVHRPHTAADCPGQ